MEVTTSVLKMMIVDDEGQSAGSPFLPSSLQRTESSWKVVKATRLRCLAARCLELSVGGVRGATALTLHVFGFRVVWNPSELLGAGTKPNLLDGKEAWNYWLLLPIVAPLHWPPLKHRLHS